MKVQDILTDESKWTKHYSAVDGHGEEVEINSERAAAFCLYGAVEIAYCGEDDWAEVTSKIEIKIGLQMSDWNDAPERTFAEVRGLIEELDI